MTIWMCTYFCKRIYIQKLYKKLIKPNTKQQTLSINSASHEIFNHSLFCLHTARALGLYTRQVLGLHNGDNLPDIK